MNVQADEAAIVSALRRYEHAVNDGDLETWLSLWCNDAIRMAPDAPAASGIDAIRKSAANMFAPNVTEMTVQVDEVRALGEWGIGRGTYTFKLTPGGTASSIAGSGKFLTIFAREADGEWRLARDCHNLDGPRSS